VRRNYHTIDEQGKVGERKLAEFLVRNGQALLPMLELIEQSRLAIDELIDVMGRASVEAVLELSAREVAGVPQRGKARQGEVVWHGRQQGRVCLRERQLRVTKPRLRKKGRGENKEVSIPAYEAMRQNATTGQRMLEILLDGVSTRRYRRVIPEMADTVGVSRSTVSREAAEASAAALQQLLERRFDDVDLLIIYIDGMHFGEQCVLAAVGVDVEGRKHVLAIGEGATENAAAAKDLLEHLVSQGVDASRRRLFIIDGSKALRTAINAVFGLETPVQRCRNHIAGRDPRSPEGWKVPSRASPYEPGSLGSGTAGRLAVSKQTRHVASAPSPEARANVQVVPKGNVWRRHGISNGYYWESSGLGWSSRLCIGEDSNGCGCIGKGSSRHPRCFEQRHERKEA
jgi:hypothetical protein